MPVRHAVVSLLVCASLARGSFAQTQPDPDLVNALSCAETAEQQDALLAQAPIDNALLMALRDRADAYVTKSEFTSSQRVSELVLRLARRIGDRSSEAWGLVETGANRGSLDQAAKALEPFNEALAIYQQLGDKRGIARAISGIGNSYRLLGRLEEAIDHLGRALPICEESGDRKLLAAILNQLGIAHRIAGRNDLALEYYARGVAIAREEKDLSRESTLLTSIANAHQAQGSYEVALQYYEQARAIREQLGDKGGLAVALTNVGIIYNYLGRYDKALALFQKSIRINQERGADANKSDLAFNYHSIGYLYRHQGLYEQALEYYGRALALREEINDKFGVLLTRTNIGGIYVSQGRYAEALTLNDETCRDAEEMKARDSVAGCFTRGGEIARLQKRYSDADELLQKALTLYAESGNRRSSAGALRALARSYEEQGRYAEMLELSTRAATLAEEINAREEYWSAREHAGRACAALKKYDEAKAHFTAAIAAVESLRLELAGSEQQQQSFLAADNRLSPWLGMIDVLIREKSYSEALVFAERSKARVLLDTLNNGRAQLRTSLSAEERSAEEHRRLYLVSLNSQLSMETRSKKADAARIASLTSDITKARLDYEDFETGLYSAHPEMKANRGDAPVIRREELAGLLPDRGSVLLEYVVGERQTYLFVISGDAAIDVHTLPVGRAELAKLIETFRQQLSNRDPGFRASAEALYRHVLAPAEAQLRGKRQIVIAPDDMLWDLPFQALVNGAKRFLIEDFAVAYTPSLTVLREITRRKRDRSGAVTLLAVGNPKLGSMTDARRAELAGRDTALAPLPEAEQEVRALQKLYGASRSRVYVGAAAREDRLKRDVQEASVLHFATHAVLNDSSPMYSYLALAAGDAREDGFLEAWELMQLDLKADLAVLSACETARGRVRAGEGMIGLSWAMFIAGVPSVVVSQWKVESAGTRDLMVNFHRARLAASRPTNAQAMRQAVLALMKNRETRHPFYWAGFIVVGGG
jgi:CHAT domain-containing protein